MEGEEKKIHQEVVHQYGISLLACVTSAFFTFPQVSLEMVAMTTQCPRQKIFKMWMAAFILSLIASLLAVFPSHIVYFFLNAICSSFFFIVQYSTQTENPHSFGSSGNVFDLDYNIWQFIRNTIYTFMLLDSLKIN